MSMSERLDVLPWPTKSTELKIIEYKWVRLFRRVYYGFRQFKAVENLKEFITFQCEK